MHPAVSVAAGFFLPLSLLFPWLGPITQGCLCLLAHVLDVLLIPPHVTQGMPGFSVGKPEDKLGWRCQPTCTVSLEKVRVPSENLVGSLGEGFKIAMTALDGGRLNIAACSLGGAAYCLDYAWQYSHQRQQFGQRVADFQASQFKLADMGTQLAASRALVMAAAAALDAKVCVVCTVSTLG